MKKTRILSLSLVPISLLLVSCEQDTPTSLGPEIDVSLARSTNIDAFDMVDDFSGSGAEGNGFVKVTDSQMDLTIHARRLEADHPYEVHVIVGPEGNPDLVEDLNDLIGVHVFPVTSDKNGKFHFRIRDFDLGLDPGQYRLDYLVLHDLLAHDHDQNTFPTFLVLACLPASFVTIDG